MRRMLIIAALLSPLLVTGSPPPAKAADVGISIRIGDRYRGDNLRFSQRPRMAVVPGSRVYYVQDSDQDVYRYGRYYYAFDSGRWYRSANYRGPWIHVRGRTVPRQIYAIPSDYRRNWRGNYNQWRNRDYDDSWEQYRGNRRDRDGNRNRGRDDYDRERGGRYDNNRGN